MSGAECEDVDDLEHAGIYKSVQKRGKAFRTRLGWPGALFGWSLTIGFCKSFAGTASISLSLHRQVADDAWVATLGRVRSLLHAAAVSFGFFWDP